MDDADMTDCKMLLGLIDAENNGADGLFNTQQQQQQQGSADDLLATPQPEIMEYNCSPSMINGDGDGDGGVDGDGDGGAEGNYFNDDFDDDMFSFSNTANDNANVSVEPAKMDTSEDETFPEDVMQEYQRSVRKIARRKRESSGGSPVAEPKAKRPKRTRESSMAKCLEQTDFTLDDATRIAALKLVTPKEMDTEHFIREIINALPTPDNAAASEVSKLWIDQAKQKLTELSVTLSHKVMPLVHLLLEQKSADKVSRKFARISVQPADTSAMVKKYKACFNAWVDAQDYVSFKATNQKLLGKVDVKDMYIFTFFTFATCQRTKNDNLLMLGISGASTSGKSTIFESVLMEGSHVTTNESGVGRFNMGNKPVLMFHDIDIRVLVASPDTVKIKTFCRTEPTVAKIHGTILPLGPGFFFYSCNKRLMSHQFNTVIFNGPSSMRWKMYPSQANDDGRKRVSIEDLQAIQNRFIECFVRAPPTLPEDLPTTGGFQRMHGVLGMIERILDMLEKYGPKDFHSPMLISYLMHGLCSNAKNYEEIMGTDGIRNRMRNALDKFVADPQEHQNLQNLLE